ncbi:hypothetical protein M758_1G225800 [Ceratodon purpureus]|uniref:HIT domain-containing protein n=1 Tax=Ceratodon purpureus TaxID=3225 RepID=A0A8T0J8W2_CERPU|nr:hypothetical protein KC19_1G194000 [Ceratodon purpureus]KAG0631077.1 hypothetical protein M758_1G225800 [Ceratodon purpureus]
MLRLSPFRRRLPSQIFQRPVLEVVRSVWRGSRSPCSSLLFGRDPFRACTNATGLILRGNLERPSRTLCSLVGSSKGRTKMAASDAPHEVSEQAEKTFYFGKFKIDPTEVILVTQHSYAFVNLKPVVPGHILYTGKKFSLVSSVGSGPS